VIGSKDISIIGDVYWDLVGTWECLLKTFLSWQMTVIGADIRVLTCQYKYGSGVRRAYHILLQDWLETLILPVLVSNVEILRVDQPTTSTGTQIVRPFATTLELPLPVRFGVLPSSIFLGE